MMCARREAGARRPASSTSADSPRRPEPRPGRGRARLALLLPALALLLGLFGVAPVAAQAPTGKPVITSSALLHLGYEIQWREFTGQEISRDPSVTGYDVQYRESGTQVWTDVSHSGTQQSARITGLTEGTEYQARVRKTNADGAGPWSEIENLAAVRSRSSVPDPPFGFRVTPGNAKATFTWSAPAHTGGRDLTGYRIEVREVGATSNFKTVNVSGATSTSGEVTGLTNGTAYEGLVRALYTAVGRTTAGRTTARLEFTPKASTRQVSFAQSSYSVAEGESVTVTVNVSPALTSASSVNLVLASTTAADSDYTVTGLAGIRLTLPAGETSTTFTVAAVSDMATEGSEKIQYVLEAISAADYVVSASGETTVVTISDTQQATVPTVSFQ